MPKIDAKPFHYEFGYDHVALVCIDMQRDFCQPGGFAESLGDNIQNIQPCIPVIARLQAAFRKASLPIIHTKECHKPDLSDLPPAKRDRGNPTLRIGDEGPMGRILIHGEPGHGIVTPLAPVAGELVIDKPGKGSFYATDLEMILRTRGIQNIVLAGITTDVCVHTTMRDANDRGFECLLLSDCTAATDPGNHAAALKMITMQGGVFGAHAPSTALIAALATGPTT